MNNISKLAFAISLALGTGNVVAAVDITKSSEANTYASELKTALSPTVTLLTGGSVCSLDLEGVIGVDIPLSNAASTTTRYFRFDFSGELTTLNSVMGDGDFSIISPSTAVTLGIAAISRVGGGNVGDNYVIYSVTMSDSDSPIDAEDTFQLTMPSLNVDTQGVAVQVTYTVHTNDVSASQGVNGDDIVESVRNASYLNFAAGLAAGVIPVNSTASVEADFLEFLNDSNRSTVTTANLGTFNLRAADQVCNAAGSSISLVDLLGTTVSLEINGNFEAIQDIDSDNLGTGEFATAVTDNRVYLSTAANCSTKDATGTLAFSNENETVTMSTVNPNILDNSYLCFGRPIDSQVIIPTYREYSLTLRPAGGLVGETALPLGDIIQDGTVLESPYFTLTPGYISRFMLAHLMPELLGDVRFTIKLRTDSGNELTPNLTPTTPNLTYDATAGVFRGTMSPGSLLQINASDLVSGFTANARGSAVFTFVSTNAAMQGVYQAVNIATGEVSNIIMPRPGGGTGK